MTISLEELKAKSTGKDPDLGAALAAATGVIAATRSEDTAVAIAGVIVAGVILAVAVAGRYQLRRGSVDAAGLTRASEAAAGDNESLGEILENVSSARDEDLLRMVAEGQSEQTGNEIPPSLAELPEEDPEGDV